MVPEFSIGKTKIIYEINENVRSQRMRLTILGDKVLVRGPAGTTEKEAEDLLTANQTWIYTKLLEAKENPTIDPWPDRFIPGAKVLWNGRWEHIRSCVQSFNSMRIEISFNNGFNIQLPERAIDRAELIASFEEFFKTNNFSLIQSTTIEGFLDKPAS